MTHQTLAISLSADFYPGLREDESAEEYDGNALEWTFSVPTHAACGPGIYEIRFVRTLAEEEALGFPVLAGKRNRYSDTDKLID